MTYWAIGGIVFIVAIIVAEIDRRFGRWDIDIYRDWMRLNDDHNPKEF